MACFDRELADVEEACSQLPLVVAQPRPLLHDSGDGRAIEVEQSTVMYDPAQECGVAGEILLAPIHVRCELRLHPEQLGKVHVDAMEVLIERGRFGQDWLNVERTLWLGRTW